jgi:ankyrin repeat protein
LEDTIENKCCCNTPLAAACFKGNERIAELLLAQGAEFEGSAQPGSTPASKNHIGTQLLSSLFAIRFIRSYSASP